MNVYTCTFVYYNSHPDFPDAGAGAKEAVVGSIGGEELMEVARRAAEGGGLFVQDALARPAEPGTHPGDNPEANRWLL